MRFGIKAAVYIILSIIIFSSAALGVSTNVQKINENATDRDFSIPEGLRNGDGRGAIDVNPLDDAQVVEGYPSSNYGANTYMYVQSASSGASSYQDERAWVKFDLNGQLPSGSTIDTAKLLLYCWKADGPDMQATAHGSTDDVWDEMSITWNNQPIFDIELDTIQLIQGQINIWREWNVTTFVQTQWNDDKVVSLVVKPTVEGASPAHTFAFDSKEWSGGNYAPILQVEYTTVPGQPIVSDIPDQFIELGNTFSPITLDDYVEDPDHQDDEINWTYSGNSGLMVDIDPGNHIATITPPTSEWVGQETITFRATDPDLLWDEDSAIFTVTPWIETATSPYIHSYAVGVVSAGDYIILANGEISGSSKIMKYNISSNSWTTINNPPYHFKNSVAMEWDRNNYIYILFGGSYSDCQNQARHYFSRMNIHTNTWENLPDTPWYQGPGDAITWVTSGENEYIYTLLGSSSCSGAPWGYPGPPYPEGVQFWRYNITGNVWDQNLTRIPYGSDDGADLQWTGGDYIYAFCGAYNEGLPKDEERHFLRYSISTDTWVELENTPYNADGGIDDGGSLLYPGYGDHIYALKGGDDGAGGGGSPGDDFWRYIISNDSWEIMPSIPLGVGDQNGHRLGYYNGKIYCWRGCFADGTLWAYSINTPPDIPTTPVGPHLVPAGYEHEYCTVTTDPENHQIYYKWIDDSSEWIGPYDSGDSACSSFIWEIPGCYSLRVMAIDDPDGDGDLSDGLETNWSESLLVHVVIPGDLDSDGDVDLSDLAQLLAHYGMTSGATYEDGDIDGDGDVDLADLAELLAHYGEGT